MGMKFKSAVAARLMQLAEMEFVVPPGWQEVGLIAELTFGTKIWTGLPSLYFALEKLPLRSGIVGTVEKASYGLLPRDPFHPPKKNHLLPPLKIFGMFSGPPTFAPKRDWL